MKWFFLSVAILIFLLGLILIVRRAYFLTKAIRAHGEVMDVEVSKMIAKGKEVEFYYPKVKYSTTSGESFTFKCRNGSGKRPDTGEKVTVWYLPDNPHKALLDGFRYIWAFPVASLIFGAVISGLILYKTKDYVHIYAYLVSTWHELSIFALQLLDF